MFGFGKNINDEVKALREVEDALLIDVRSKQEYAEGHIPGAVNFPLSELDYCISRIGSTDRPLFCYCLSGARSRQAAGKLKRLGFTNVKNIGGIGRWKGSIEK